MKKEIITINGRPGSGKSSTANKVAEALEYTRFSSGNFLREIGLELGLTINEVNIRAETDPEIDYKIDERVKGLNNEKNLVIDSRMAFHWIPDSFKVYLDLPPEIAKERIVHDIQENESRKASEDIKSAEDAYEKIIERFNSEQKRYWDLYQVDNTDHNQYDLVIDTNENNLEEVVSIILKRYKEWLEA